MHDGEERKKLSLYLQLPAEIFQIHAVFNSPGIEETFID